MGPFVREFLRCSSAGAGSCASGACASCAAETSAAISATTITSGKAACFVNFSFSPMRGYAREGVMKPSHATREHPDIPLSFEQLAHIFALSLEAGSVPGELAGPARCGPQRGAAGGGGVPRSG
jgi:hypothetical protein